MLGKLLKHEFKQSARTLLPILGGATVMLLLAKLMTMLDTRYARLVVFENGTELKRNTVLSLLTSITMFLFVMMLTALLIGTLIVVVQRFYRMLGDEGYVMFALPVTPAQHIWAKTIPGVTWIMAAFAFCCVSFPFLLMSGDEQYQPVVMDDIAARGQVVWTVVLLVICAICGAWAAMWLAYLACTIGAKFGHHRMVASIGAFFILQIILQVLFLLAIWIVSSLWNETQIAEFFYRLQDTDPMTAILTGLAIALGVLVVSGAVFYALMHRNLSKKLNLA